MNIFKKGLSILILAAILLGALSGCGSKEEVEFRTEEDFKQARIGILTGSSFDLLAKEYFPESKKLYYINLTDLILNLKQEKIDGILMDKGFYAPLIWEGEGLSFIRMDMPETQYAMAFPKTAASKTIKSQLNEFINKQTQNGWIDEQKKRWFSDSEPEGVPDFSQLSGENGTLRVATSVEIKPFSYMKNGQLFGYDMDFIFRFAQEYGYALKIDTMDFGAILPSLSAGRYDFAISGITITEERMESVDFSDPYCSCPVVMAVNGLEDAVISSLADLENVTLGIVTGTTWDIVAQTNFPDAERKYFTTSADVLLALEQGKVDAFFVDRSVFAGINWENKNIAHIDEPVKDVSNALILAKEGYDENLLNQINEFVAKSKSDGFLNNLADKWFGTDEPTEHPDYTKLTGENGTIRVAVTDAMKPTAYRRGDLITGYEIDFLTRFAEEYGYKLDVEGMAFDALIPSVSSRKCDVGAAGITITPERSESVTFTASHFETYGVAVIRNESAVKTEKKTLDDFKNAVIGVQTGSVYENYAKKLYPDAQRMYFAFNSDMILALEQEKIDGFIGENTFMISSRWEGTNLVAAEGVIDQTNAGYIFAKDPKSAELRNQVNEFLRKAKEEGILDELKKKWLGDTEPTEFIEHDASSGKNGTINVAVSADTRPVCYLKNNKIVGYDIEVLHLFADEYDYKLNIIPITFDAILPGVISGKYDIGASGITITEERAQSVDFSESNMTVDVLMIANEIEDATGGVTFWDEIKESFEKTFIREDRWKLIAEGIVVTMIISIFSALFGTLLGFALYLLSRSDAKALQKLTKGFSKVYSRIIAGTPIVVILMILFFVVFGNVRNVNGVIVAIIGFTLSFGAFVYDHMTVSVNSVDYGQTEAAYALGYTKNKAFFRIVLPQAMKIFLPSYCGQSVDLIKATAVVGYIAVNDLTKMGDIIRSNTYEAFFPLIAIAVIYFILTWIIALLLNIVKNKFEPKRRDADKILKGTDKEPNA